MKKVLFLFFVLFLQTVFAQNYKIQKVTEADLLQTEHPREKDANAAMIYSISNSEIFYISDKHLIRQDVKLRIKIYNKDGLDMANKTISFYSGDGLKEIVKVGTCTTYNLEGGKIVRSNLKKEGEFVEKNNEYWSNKKIVMPNVKEGSIVEINYSIESPIMTKFPTWYFQSSIPVDYSEYSVLIPELLEYTPYFKGSFQPKVVTKMNAVTLDFTRQDILNATKGFAYELKRNDGTHWLTFNELSKVFYLTDIPSVSNESYVNNIANYISGIEYTLSAIRKVNGQFTSYALTKGDLIKKIIEDNKYLSKLEDSNYFKNDLENITKNLTRPDQKADSIYYFVKNKMTWNDENSYLPDGSLSSAYKKGEGNVADINLILVSMFKAAGLKANPVLLSTRSNGIKPFPSLQSYNYVIAEVEMLGNSFYFDATSKFGVPNILPIRALNWQGVSALSDQKIKDVDLYPKFLSQEIVSINAGINEEGKLTGKVRQGFTLYKAFGYRDYYGNIAPNTFKENKERQNQGLSVDNFVMSNFSDLSKSLMYAYDFTDSSSIDVINNRLFISPMLFLTMKESPFKSENRDFPIDFIYPSTSKTTIRFSIPNGYTLESLPENAEVHSDSNLGLSFEYGISQVGNVLNITFVETNKNAIINGVYYKQVKEFYDIMVRKQAEKIVLKKE